MTTFDWAGTARAVTEAHPGVRIDSEAFAARARALGDVAFPSDLALAFAVTRGDPEACRLLHQSFDGEVRAAMRGVGLAHDAVEDATQQLWARLFGAVPGEASPLHKFRGSGSLRSWLRVCATRQALNLRNRARHFEPLSGVAEALVASSADLEVALSKLECREHVKSAIDEALNALPARLQNVLRHRFLDQLSSEEIGRLYGVHRATVDRWISLARARLVRGCRSHLQVQLSLGPEAASRLVAQVVGSLEVSFAILRGEPRPRP